MTMNVWNEEKSFVIFFCVHNNKRSILMQMLAQRNTDVQDR